MQPHPRVHAADHPLIAHYLTRARDRDTASPRFRELVGQVGAMLAYEATRDLTTRPATVDTPLEPCTGLALAQPISIVPILRAGMGFADPILRLIPDASMGHLGLYRRESDLTPVAYYENLPASVSQGPVLLLDPMLATGGSAVAAVNVLRKAGATDIRFVALLAAPEGIDHLVDNDPDVRVFVGCIDRQLSDVGYILPGLGDAGDRLFGTL
ncbi:MAG: uracil phosphoribosyltransferase [Planctomycetota bacterium]